MALKKTVMVLNQINEFIKTADFVNFYHRYYFFFFFFYMHLGLHMKKEHSIQDDPNHCYNLHYVLLSFEQTNIIDNLTLNKTFLSNNLTV